VADIAGPFAVGTFVRAGREFPGLVADGKVRDLSPEFGTTLDLLRDWDAAMSRCAGLAHDQGADDQVANDDRAWLTLSELRIAPPLRPGQILQSGANYRQHVVDLIMSERDAYGGRSTEQVRADAEALMAARAAGGEPYLFIGLASAMCGARDDVVLPPEGREHDWELELAAVIGRPARRVSRAEAMSHVAAYTICNDITTRDRLYRDDLKKIGTDWLRAKNAPTFLPTGPFLVPAAFITDPMDLRITLRHNGQVRQDESTKDMIFDVAALIAYASTLTELAPGDLILTGSPAGNGAHWGTFLSPGDVMEAEITGLGTQRNSCVGGDEHA
jgi:2-keto-4-pentenoate hydratase/2-oxohepta-3-ene-1,7-dioic acid hydratase in catechol pathway